MKHKLPDSDDRGERHASVYIPPSPLRDTSSKCAAPPCTSRVAYAGDFCRDCIRVQREMQQRLRARKRA